MKHVILDGITKKYGGKNGIEDISIEIGSKTYGIIGKNGSGKTTLLKILATQLKPDKGKGKLLGFDLLDNRNEIRLEIGALTGGDKFYRQLTLRENLEFIAEMQGVSYSRAEKLLNETTLPEYEDRKYSELSSGMKRMAGLISAIISKPTLLILDEPFYTLDIDNIEIAKQQVKENCKYLIMSAHYDMPEIFGSYCMLEKGRITGTK